MKYTGYKTMTNANMHINDTTILKRMSGPLWVRIVFFTVGFAVAISLSPPYIKLIFAARLEIWLASTRNTKLTTVLNRPTAEPKLNWLDFKPILYT